MPNEKAPPRLAAMSDLAEQGVTIGYEVDPARLQEYISGLKMDARSLTIHRDPVLSSQTPPLYIVAVYTNRRDRPIYSLYCLLRLSPRNRDMTTFFSRPILPGQRVAFVYEVQKTVSPEVAHFHFSETAGGLGQTGQAITQHVPKKFLVGTHSASVTSVGGGVKDAASVVQADAQPDHFEKPAGHAQFPERAQNLGTRYARR